MSTTTGWQEEASLPSPTAVLVRSHDKQGTDKQGTRLPSPSSYLPDKPGHPWQPFCCPAAQRYSTGTYPAQRYSTGANPAKPADHIHDTLAQAPWQLQASLQLQALWQLQPPQRPASLRGVQHCPTAKLPWQGCTAHGLLTGCSWAAHTLLTGPTLALRPSTAALASALLQ